MKTLTQTLIIKHGTYQPGEFLPIWSGSELLNADDYIKYVVKRKAKQLLQRIAR